MTETNAGHTPYDLLDGSFADRTNATGRCPCGAEADGYDAQLEEPTCAECAELWADGGTVLEDSRGDSNE